MLCACNAEALLAASVMLCITPGRLELWQHLSAAMLMLHKTLTCD
jgi:hypothetical protein